MIYKHRIPNIYEIAFIARPDTTYKGTFSNEKCHEAYIISSIRDLLLKSLMGDTYSQLANVCWSRRNDNDIFSFVFVSNYENRPAISNIHAMFKV